MVTGRAMPDLSSDEGMTLVELLVVVALFLFVIAAAWLMLGSLTKSSDSVAARQVAQDEARTTVERTARELRQGMEIAEGTGVFALAEPRNCQFFADVDQDGVADLVKYSVSGSTLTRQVLHSTVQVPVLASQFTIIDPPQVMAKSIDASWTGAMFTYYSNEDPPAQQTNATRDEISAVEVRIVCKATSGIESVVIDQKSLVKIRAVWSNLN